MEDILLFITAVIILTAVIGITVYFLQRHSKDGHIPDADEIEIAEAGRRGEDEAYNFLCSCLEPYGYTVLRNKNIFYNGKKSEIDNIVVGKTGVFIVEVKNIRGLITGNCDDNYWMQYKIDKWGEMHCSSFYSPIKQVGTHTYRLAHFLRDNKIKVFINNAVYFVNCDVRVNIEGVHEKTPVFQYTSRAQLIDCILSKDERLTRNEINEIVRLIKRGG